MQLLLGSLISGGLGLAKSIIGGIQAAKGNKRLNNLLSNRPQYTIPEAYQKALGIAQQMAGQEMPGMQRYQDMYGQATARAVNAAEKGAISSNVYQGAISNAQDKELQALQQLALMGVEYKTNAMKNLQQAQNQMGQLQDTAWNINKMQPWDIRANMANEQKIAGMQNLFGGLGEIGSTVLNLTGTKYYMDAMKSIYGTAGNTTPAGNTSAPLNNAQLANTAFNAMRKPVGMTPYEEWMWQLRQKGISNGEL